LDLKRHHQVERENIRTHIQIYKELRPQNLTICTVCGYNNTGKNSLGNRICINCVYSLKTGSRIYQCKINRNVKMWKVKISKNGEILQGLTCVSLWWSRVLEVEFSRKYCASAGRPNKYHILKSCVDESWRFGVLGFSSIYTFRCSYTDIIIV